MHPLQRKFTLTILCLTFILAFSSTNILAAPGKPDRPPRPALFSQAGRYRSATQRDSAAPTPITAETPNWPASAWSKIVYESWQAVQDEYHAEIYLADGYGTPLLRLTTNEYDDLEPRLNRGCTQIAFTSYQDGNFEIFTMDPSGSNVTNRSNYLGSDRNPTWHPDGSRIAFQSLRTASSDLYVMNSDGSNQIRLTNDARTDQEPAFSPDGTELAFSSNRPPATIADMFIWKIDYDKINPVVESNPVQLSNRPGSGNPAWSPDGEWIAFSADYNNNSYYELWIMDKNGGNEVMLHELPNDYDPQHPEENTFGGDLFVRSWSPDGQYIAVTRVDWSYNESKYEWEVATWLNAWDTQASSLISLGGNLDGNDFGPDWRTCDALAPVSAVNALPAVSSASFLVSWGGSDQTGAGQGQAGIEYYDIQVRDGPNGPWQPWQEGTTSTSGTFNGLDWHTYYFRSRARDYAYNLEEWPASYDTYTNVNGVRLFLPNLAR